MPEADSDGTQSSDEGGPKTAPSAARPQRNSALTVILIGVGAVMLMSNVGWNLMFGFVGWGIIWAVGFIVLGLYMLGRWTRST